MREVSRRRYRWLGRDEKQRVLGRLPAFSRSLGLDVIITEAGLPVLVELQHGFGRRGLIRLFPEASRQYRKTYWQLRRECGRSHFAAEEIRRVCSDKICTYRHFEHHQPRSLVYRRWDSTVESWLDGLSSEYVLAKPPRGSCGTGILVFDRAALRRSGGAWSLGSPPLLLQEFIRSRPLLDEKGRAHLGCIRHIVVIRSDGQEASIVHLPPYWRVSPEPVTADTPDKEALTANISRGAYPLPVSESDAEMVRRFADGIIDELLRLIFELEEVRWGPSKVVESLPSDSVVKLSTIRPTNW
jgi:hypothetical protein